MDATQSTAAPRPTNSKAIWIIVLIGAVLFLGWTMFVRPRIQLERATKHPAVGHRLPILELQPLTGTSEGVSSTGVEGKVTLINFWGPWCGYCVQEFPHLVELWDRYRGRSDFVFLSVSSGGSLNEDVSALGAETEAFLKSRGTNLPVYVDPTGANRQLLGSLTGRGSIVYPTTVLLDRRGVIRAFWEGCTLGTPRQIELMTSKLLAETE